MSANKVCQKERKHKFQHKREAFVLKYMFSFFPADFICAQILKICVALAAPRAIASLCLCVFIRYNSNYLKQKKTSITRTTLYICVYMYIYRHIYIYIYYTYTCAYMQGVGVVDEGERPRRREKSVFF